MPKVDGLGAADCGGVGLGELVVRGGEADLESFGFAGPAFAFGLGDAGEEAVADVLQAAALGGVDSQERAADAGLINAAGPVGAAAGAEGGAWAPRRAGELLPL